MCLCVRSAVSGRAARAETLAVRADDAGATDAAAARRRFMDKKCALQLKNNRRVSGVLRGFDPFMNVVLDQVVEERGEQGQSAIPDMVVVRGSSIVLIEPLEAIQGGRR